MHFETVYEVLDDGYHLLGWEWIGIVIGGLILPWFLAEVHRYKWRMTGFPPRENPWVGVVVAGVALVVCVNITVIKVVAQFRCRRWAESGEYQPVTGDIVVWYFGKGYTNITVGGTHFTFDGLSGGFRGKFTKQGFAPPSLPRGQAVRIRHHKGRILRIDIAVPKT